MSNSYQSKFIKDTNIPIGKWFVLANYVYNNLNEKVHPTKDVLDKAAPNTPIFIKHQSGHNGVFNSLALK